MNEQQLENNLNRVQEWIRAADNKVSVLLALEGIAITLLLSDSVVTYATSLQYNRWSIVLMIASVVFLFMSAYKAVLAIIPRLKRKKMRASLLYFGSIATMELGDFEKKVKSMDESQYRNQLIEQTHMSSVIASAKHNNFKDSIIALSISFVFLALTLILQFSSVWLVEMI